MSATRTPRSNTVKSQVRSGMRTGRPTNGAAHDPSQYTVKPRSRLLRGYRKLLCVVLS